MILRDIYHLAAVSVSFFGGNPRLEGGGTVLSPLERWGSAARVGAQADMPAGELGTTTLRCEIHGERVRAFKHPQECGQPVSDL